MHEGTYDLEIIVNESKTKWKIAPEWGFQNDVEIIRKRHNVCI